MRSVDDEGAHAAGARRWLMFAASTSLFVCSQFYRVANAVIAPELQRDLQLSSAALGGLSAAFFYAFALAQLPLALSIDRLGARRVMTALSMIGVAGAAVFASARGEATATLGRVLLGIGMAGNLIGSMKAITRWFSPREFATVSGLLVALGTLGNVLATSPLAMLVRAVGWRGSFWWIAAATAGLTSLFWIVVRDSPSPAPREESREVRPPPIQMLGRLLTSRDYWLISAGAFCRYGAYLAIQGLWAGPYLTQAVGLSDSGAAAMLLLLNLSFVAGAPAGGWLSDRVLRSRRSVALASLTGTALALLALAADAVRDRPWLVALVFVALGVASSFGQVMYAHIKELVPADMAGMAMTGVNCFVMLGAAVFIQGMGWVLDRAPGRYGVAFLVSAAVVATAAFLYRFTSDPRVIVSPTLASSPRGVGSAQV